MGSEGQLTHPTDQAMIKAAHRLHHDEGDIEIDDFVVPLPTARVSRGDDNEAKGAYVLAWLWVEDGDVTEEDKKP